MHHQLVQRVVADTGADAEVTRVEKIEDIMEYGVAFTPAMVIDGTVKAAGGIPKAVMVGVYFGYRGLL